MAKKLTPADLIARLRGAGYSAKEIGDVLGRNNRMVYRVANGERDAPTGWEESLRRMWTNANNRARHGRARATVEQLRATVPEPPRRTTTSGAAPRLRRGIWTTGRGWATGVVQGQASRSGALALVPGVEMAVSRMWRLAVTIAFREKAGQASAVQRGAKHYEPKRVPQKPGGIRSKKVKLWYAQSRIVPVDLLRRYGDEGGTSLTVAILEHLRDEEIIDFTSIEDAVGEVEQIEMRLWQ